MAGMPVWLRWSGCARPGVWWWWSGRRTTSTGSRAHGFTYLSFPGSMWMEFRDAAEAIEMAEIFYPHAAAEVRARGAARVDYEVLGVNPPRDLAFKKIRT